MIRDPIADLFNQMFIDGKLPDVFKIAKILPLQKKDSYEDPPIFRPESLLSSISKVIEKMLFKCLLKFIKKFYILAIEQLGFRKIVHVSQLSLQQQKFETIGMACFIDFQKAFDTIDHTFYQHVDTICRKLDQYQAKKVFSRKFLLRFYNV